MARERDGEPELPTQKQKNDVQTACPRHRPEIREFAVKDELILVAPVCAADLLDDGDNNRALTLNTSGRAIWQLCDGHRSAEEIVDALSEMFPVDRQEISRQTRDAMSRMSRLGFLDGYQKSASSGTNRTFVIGVEDKPYFWWQTAIFLESFSGKLPQGWRTLVVVCNSGEPISGDLQAILDRYETDVAQGTNYTRTHKLDIGHDGGQFYSPLNRIEALSVASRNVDDDDIICLLDSDTFIYGEINTEIMPSGCAAARNWHIEDSAFFSTVAKNNGKGLDLRKILEAMGCEQEFQPGGVNVFVTGKVAKNGKYIADCFRFAHALYLLGRASGIDNVWMSEMPCFTLAMTANGIEYKVLEQKEFLVSDPTEFSIPEGTIYHYYCDPGDAGQAAFHESKWHKQAYWKKNFLRSDFSEFASNAKSDHERYFFQLAKSAQERIYV
jgi:hypothetical protein